MIGNRNIKQGETRSQRKIRGKVLFHPALFFFYLYSLYNFYHFKFYIKKNYFYKFQSREERENN
jgi:hypothetical protein